MDKGWMKGERNRWMDFDVLIQHVVDVLVILKAKIKSVLLQSFTSDKCGSVVLSLYGVCNHIITYAIKFAQVQNIYCISVITRNHFSWSLCRFSLPSSQLLKAPGLWTVGRAPLHRWPHRLPVFQAQLFHRTLFHHQTNTPDPNCSKTNFSEKGKQRCWEADTPTDKNSGRTQLPMLGDKWRKTTGDKGQGGGHIHQHLGKPNEKIVWRKISHVRRLSLPC